MRITAVLPLTGLATALVGCAPVLQGEVPHDRALLSGLVKDSATGAPIAGAVINFSDEFDFVVSETDDSGNFSIVINGDTRGKLLADARGYTSKGFGFSVHSGATDYVELELRAVQDECADPTKDIGGVGFALAFAPNGDVLVKDTWHGTPSAGLVPSGFSIVDVDGVQISGMSKYLVPDWITGPPDTEVVLTGRRAPDEPLEDIVLTRATISVESGYLRYKCGLE